MDSGMWIWTWKILSVTSRQPKQFIVRKPPSENDYKNRRPQHLCKQKQGVMKVC